MEKELKNQKQLILVDEDGTEVLCDIIFTFDSDEYGKSYVIFSPVSSEEDDDGNIEVAAAIYVPKEDGTIGDLIPIESDEEWELVESVLGQFDEEQCGCCDCEECEEECDCDECEEHHHHHK